MFAWISFNFIVDCFLFKIQYIFSCFIDSFVINLKDIFISSEIHVSSKEILKIESLSFNKIRNSRLQENCANMSWLGTLMGIYMRCQQNEYFSIV